MKKLLTIAVVIVAIVALVWAGLQIWSRMSAPPLVEYKIEGTAQSVLVTIHSSSDNPEYHTGITLPTSFKFKEFEGSTLSITAENEGGTGSVKVSIYYNGKLVKSHGSTTIAEAIYQIP